MFLGIDPGKTGALALYDPATGALEVSDVPILEVNGKRVVDHYSLARIVDNRSEGGCAYPGVLRAMGEARPASRGKDTPLSRHRHIFQDDPGPLRVGVDHGQVRHHNAIRLDPTLF